MRSGNEFTQTFSICLSLAIIMSTTIQQGLRPLFLMCFIMGLGVYPTKQPNKSRFHKWVVYLSFLYFLLIWFVYNSVFFYAITIFSPKIIIYDNFTLITITAINKFTAIFSAFSIFYHHKKFQICMTKLAGVDDTLEKLGTPKMYQNLHMLSKRVIIGWIVYIIIINIYCALYWFEYVKVFWGSLLLLITSYHHYINEFTDLIFIFLLWYIGTRFDKINDYMHCLLLKEDHGLKYMWKKSIIIHGYFLHRHNYKRTFWTSMHLYLELCRIARELNAIFGIQITLKMMMHLANLTSDCNYFWYIFVQKHQDKEIDLLDFVDIGLDSFMCLIRLYSVNHICESVKNKANSIDKIIHQFTNTLRYADIWKEIDFFVLQVTQHPLMFTGLGFFHFGDKFLQKFFTTVLTFTIIIEQLNLYSWSDLVSN